MSEEPNVEEAERIERAIAHAQSTLDFYKSITGDDEESALVDMLTDVRHWSHRNDIDFAIEDERAERMYDQEMEELYEAIKLLKEHGATNPI
jgi:hypothetical protein